jgi:hypothetical protein
MKLSFSTILCVYYILPDGRQIHVKYDIGYRNIISQIFTSEIIKKRKGTFG